MHKLAFALRFRPLPRYLELARLYEEQGLSDDARWIKERTRETATTGESSDNALVAFALGDAAGAR